MAAMLRVRDLLDDFGLEVLAGERALDTEVRGVQVSDLLDPTPWLSHGELLLTSGVQLEGHGAFDDYVGRLAATDVAAVGMAGHSQLDPPPQALLRVAAGEAGLPLLAIPPNVPFIALAHAVSNQLVTEREDRWARRAVVQDALEQGTRAKPGVGPLVTALARALGATVLLCDAAGHPLVSSDAREGADPKTLRALAEEIRARERDADPGALMLSSGTRGATATGIPVSWAGRQPLASLDPHPAWTRVWLAVVRERPARTDDDLLALRQAAPLVALELLRHHVARSRERQLASETITAIVQGTESAEEVERRLAEYELTMAVAAIVVRAFPESGSSVTRAESALAASLRRESGKGLVAATGDLAVALIPGLPDDHLFALAERVGIGIAASVGSGVWLGVGRAVPAREAGTSIDEARFALEAKTMAVRDTAPPAGAFVDHGARIATFKDLGSYQLLLALQNHDSLRRFCDSILGPIEALESSYGGELLRSLQVFIEANGHWEWAARQLFCHRHTLRYRIRKVEELTGRDLESATDRIDLYLALRARALLP